MGDEARTPEAIAWRFFEESDVVVVYEPGVSLIRPKEVTAGADAYYLGIARMHPEFARAARVMDRVSGRGVEVYVRRDAER